jgi:transposase
LLGLGWEQVNGVMKRAVQRGLLRREAEPMRYVGIDEKSIARGHTYATVLTDLGRSRVWEVTPGRKEQDALAAWESLSAEQKQAVEAVAMDMWPAYENSAKAALPHAVVVHDKFHVSKHLNEAVDKVRKAEHRKLMARATRRSRAASMSGCGALRTCAEARRLPSERCTSST